MVWLLMSAHSAKIYVFDETCFKVLKYCTNHGHRFFQFLFTLLREKIPLRFYKQFKVPEVSSVKREHLKKGLL